MKKSLICLLLILISFSVSGKTLNDIISEFPKAPRAEKVNIRSFYMKKTKSNNITEMFMITEDGKEVTFIRFSGNFNIQDIKNITAQNKGSKQTTTSSSKARTKKAEEKARHRSK